MPTAILRTLFYHDRLMYNRGYREPRVLHKAKRRYMKVRDLSPARSIFEITRFIGVLSAIRTFICNSDSVERTVE
jgi:hypothetical protein